MGKQYRSDALAAVHEAALGFAEAGVMDKRTMKAFDEMCLTPVEMLTPDQIRQIRTKDEGEPSGVCALPQCYHRIGEPAGAGREASARRLLETAHAGRQAGTAGHYLTQWATSAPRRPAHRPAPARTATQRGFEPRCFCSANFRLQTADDPDSRPKFLLYSKGVGRINRTSETGDAAIFSL